MKHLITSILNSGFVTVVTSLAMTWKNNGSIEFAVWLPNYLISWAIVCMYVYFIAPGVSQQVNKRLENK